MGELYVTKSAPARGANIAPESQTRLRPKDIQTRLRLGDTPEELAELSDLSLEQIRRFEKPIIAERTDIIQRVKNHRVTGQSGSDTVGRLAKSRLLARGISDDNLHWISRRENNEPWIVELRISDSPGHGRNARWTYNHKLAVLTALDDEARWLSQVDEPTQTSAMDVSPLLGHQSDRARGGKRAAGSATAPIAVAEFSEPVEPQVSGAPLAPAPAGPAGSSGRFGRGGRRIAPRRTAAVAAGLGAAGGSAQSLPAESEMAGIVALNRWQAEKTETVAIPALNADNVQIREPAPALVGASETTAPKSRAKIATRAVTAMTAIVDPAARPARGGGRKSSRASVPSWDEIVFGAKE